VNVYPLFNRNIRSGTTLQAEWTDALWRTDITSDADKASTAVRWTGDGGLIAFDNLRFSEDIRALSFSTYNISGRNVFIEVKDRNTQVTLGTADHHIYKEINMNLTQPISKGTSSSLEIRIWNKDWDVPALGEVLLDKVTFLEQ
jgi:hypothetical protein